MKALKYIITIIAGLSAVSSFAQTPTAGTDVIKLYKTTEKKTGTTDMYTITLSSFVTGKSTIQTRSKAADIVLVLDVSGSMDDNISTTSYEPRTSQGYSFDDLNNNDYYVKVGDNYYLVNAEREQTDPYYYFTYGNNQTKFGTEADNPNSTIYSGNLYTRQWEGILVIGRYVYTAHNENYSYNSLANRTLFYNTGGDNYSLVTRRQGYRNTNYYLTYTVNGTVYYLNGTGEGTNIKPEGKTASGTDIWNGVLYQSTSGRSSKISLLKTAVNEFIDVVNNDAVTNNVDHRISIVKYADDDYYNSESDLTEGNHRYYTEVVRNLRLVSTDADDLKQAVEGIRTGGATAADYGMKKAYHVLAQTVPSTLSEDRSKVVLMFTDGDPNHGNGFSTSVASATISNSLALKDQGVTVYSVGIFPSLNNNERNYMNYVSSNYPKASSMSESGAARPESERIYFQNATSGAQLTSIFTTIAQASVADTYPLTEESTSVIDVVSKDFELPKKPDGSPFDEDDVNCHIEWAVAPDSESPDGFTWTTTRPDKSYAGDEPSVTIDPLTSRIQVNGFYYAKDDTYENGKYTQYGNWVAVRPDGRCAGAKLVIQFDVKLKADSEGGYFMPSNDISSGVYIIGEDDTPFMVKAFPVPTVSIPAICIIKDGLNTGDSQIFKVSGSNGTKTYAYNVLLTQGEEITSAGTTVQTPCYAIIKNLFENVEYTVEESDWAWAYNPSGATKIKKTLAVPLNQVPADRPDYISAEEWAAIQAITDPKAQLDRFMANYKEHIKEIQDTDGYSGDYYVIGDALCLLYRFKNTENTDLAKHAEDVVRNIFGAGGGSAEHGGVLPETEL